MEVDYTKVHLQAFKMRKSGVKLSNRPGNLKQVGSNVTISKALTVQSDYTIGGLSIFCHEIHPIYRVESAIKIHFQVYKKW
jgi:hypothetical protein